MTSSEPSEPKRSVYDICDPQYLRQLREAAGMDHVVLARTACLSVAQVRHLETENSDGLFYSDAIKRQAYKRLLMILGAEPPTLEVPHELRDAGKVAEAHLNTLDQIVAMSHQPAISRSTSDVVATGVQKIKEHWQVMAALLLLVGAVALFVLNGMQNGAQVEKSATNGSDTSSAVVVPIATTQASSAPKLVPSASAPAVPLPASSSVASAPVMAAVASAPVVAAVATSPVSEQIVVPSAVATKLGACAYTNEAMPEFTSLFAQKEGRYVYFESAANLELCVVDGNKQATLLQLKAGDKRSVYGVSPWQLSGAGMRNVQIYFQGGRISLPDANSTRFKLIEVPVAR